MSRLDSRVKLLRDAGYPAFRKDVLGFLVMYQAPRSPNTIAAMARAYLRQTAPAFRGRQDSKSLMLTLPSPVSLRIDALAAASGKAGLPLYRQDIVGALIFERSPEDVGELIKLFLRYRRAKAGDARVPGLPLRRVLLSERPKQGPRPSVREPGRVWPTSGSLR